MPVRMRAEFVKGEKARFVSHLDLMRTWERAMRRAGLPVAFSQGFNPHPRMAIASSLAVGQTGRAEAIEVVLADPIEPGDFVRRANAALPEGVRVARAKEVPPEADNPAAVVSAATYEAWPVRPPRAVAAWPQPAPDPAEAVSRFLAAGSVPITRRSDKGIRQVDLRPLVFRLRWSDGRLEMALACGREGMARPTEVLAALGFDPEAWRIERTGLYKAAGLDPDQWIAAWDV